MGWGFAASPSRRSGARSRYSKRQRLGGDETDESSLKATGDTRGDDAFGSDAWAVDLSQVRWESLRPATGKAEVLWQGLHGFRGLGWAHPGFVALARSTCCSVAADARATRSRGVANLTHRRKVRA